MVIAKNDEGYESLARQFKMRQTCKVYLGLVYGSAKASAGNIKLPIGRHPTDRKKMSVQTDRGRSTETGWKVREVFSGLTLLEIELKTGRTHLARVHCAAIGHPVVGDATYGRKGRWKALLDSKVQQIVDTVRRQMLHAWRLTFLHPRTVAPVSFESPIPEDMTAVLEALRTLAGLSPEG